MPIRTTSGGSVSVGDARREAEHEPAEDEQDRIRDAKRVGEQQERRGRYEQGEELQLLLCAETAHRAPRLVPHVRDLRNRVHPRHRRPRPARCDERNARSARA